MKTIQEYIQQAQISPSQRKLSVAQFVDDFSQRKDLKMIQPTNMLSHDPISKLFEAIAHQLCINLKLQTPDWLLKPFYLSDPYFVSDLPHSRFLALRDSPYAFRIRNIFVPFNYLSRA